MGCGYAAHARPAVYRIGLSLANDFLQRTLMFQDIFLFETRTGDEKDDKNSLQRFGVLHLLQRKILEGSVADFRVKARGWWPGTWSSSKIFHWQFVFPWVDLALLKPMKNFPWEKCAIQATKNKAKSCSFFDAIWRCSCGRSADWLKIDGRENPVEVGTLETGRCGVRCALPLQAPLDLTCTSSLSCPSSDRWESHWKRNLRQR